MKSEEIFHKAIEKAEKNGWWHEGYRSVDGITAAYLSEPEPIIFSHHFAKAFFPKTDDHGFSKAEAWKYHLQQMVLKKEPVKYLEQYL